MTDPWELAMRPSTAARCAVARWGGDRSEEREDLAQESALLAHDVSARINPDLGTGRTYEGASQRWGMGRALQRLRGQSRRGVDFLSLEAPIGDGDRVLGDMLAAPSRDEVDRLEGSRVLAEVAADPVVGPVLDAMQADPTLGAREAAHRCGFTDWRYTQAIAALRARLGDRIAGLGL